MHLSIAVPRELRGARLPLMARLVLLVLVDRANADGRCWPALETIAEDIDASRRAVVSAVKFLIDHRLVAATVHKSGGPSGAWTEYRVSVEALRAGLAAHPSLQPLPRPKRWESGAADAPLAVQEMHRSALDVEVEAVQEMHRQQCTPCTGSGAADAPEDPHGRSTEKIPTAARAPRAPGGGRKSSKGKAPKRVVTPEEHRGRGLVLAANREGYLAARGVEPVEERLPADALRLVDLLGTDEAVATVRAAYASWWKDKITLADIAAKPDKFRGTVAAPTGNRPAVQPPSNAWSSTEKVA